MLITGKWEPDRDGVAMPILVINVLGAAGTLMEEQFLVDCGADRTVLSQMLLSKLGLPVESPPTGEALSGIGGRSGYVVVQTCLECTGEDGTPVRFRGRFSAFTDPVATEMSLFGRDILNHFDLLLSHSRGEVILARENHSCRVVMSGGSCAP